MTKADEQAFFEVGVRLQMAEVRVLMEACSQLGGELAHDFPPPAFLARPPLLRSLLSLLRTTEEVEMSSLSSATMRAMLQLVDVTTRAVKHRLDPSGWTRPLPSPSSRVGRGRGGVEMAEASYSEGSKVESGGWQVWQLADATWSAVVPTLRHREACPLALPLLLRVLPLLYSPPHTASDEERDASASLWRGYLDKVFPPSQLNSPSTPPPPARPLPHVPPQLHLSPLLSPLSILSSRILSLLLSPLWTIALLSLLSTLLPPFFSPPSSPRDVNASFISPPLPMKIHLSPTFCTTGCTASAYASL